jgi:hypothetical protein
MQYGNKPWNSSFCFIARITTVALLLTAFAENGYPQGSLDSSLVSIQPNTWVKLNPKVYDAAGADITAIGIPFNNYSGVTFASDYRSILMFGGGGHGDRRGNDVWLYDVATNTWQQQYAPDPETNYPAPDDSASSMTPNQYCQNLNPCTPTAQWQPRGSTSTKRIWSSHSYDLATWDGYNRRLHYVSPNYIFGANTNLYFRYPDAYGYDISSKTWTWLNAGPGTAHWMGAATEYDPINRVIVLVSQNKVWQYNVVTNTWTRKADGPSALYQGSLVYDSVNRVMLAYGGDYAGCYTCASSDLWAYDAARDAWTKRNPTPDPQYGAPPGATPYAAFDSTNGILLLWGQGSSGALLPTWAYDVRMNSWKKMNPTGGEPPATSSLGDYTGANLVYDPIDNAFLLVLNSRQYGTISGMYSMVAELWAYRYGASTTPVDTTPPTVSIASPTALASVTGNVTLSAVANDNVGVAGVQFKVDGTDLTAEMTGLPFSTIWNSASVANGNHTISAVARDAAGNKSTANITVSASNTVSGCAKTGLADSAAILTEPSDLKPALKTRYTDSVFSTCITRVTDSAKLGTDQAVPKYSKLQAWNADQSKIMLESMQILNASDFSLYGQVQYLGSAKWSPTDPNLIYSTDGNKFVKLDIRTNTKSTLHAFTEYASLSRDLSFEEASRNGRYQALVGIKSSGVHEVFVYDIINDIKSPVFVVPSNGPCGVPAWAQMTPLGDYVIIDWGGGGEARYCTVEAYDLNMNYVATVATGHGHGDLTVDSNGVQWFVDHSPDNYVGVTGPVVKKNRIPDGYTAWKAGDTSGIQTLLTVDWYHSSHISGLAPQSGDFVIFSTFGGSSNGWQTMEREVIKIYLDSTTAKPHIERLAHSRSDYDYVNSSCSTTSYWSQPHATVNRSGNKILFGSSWGANCVPDTYLLDLSPGNGKYVPAPGNLRKQ